MSVLSNNSLYVHGDQNVEIPAHLNFGKYMLERLKTRKSDATALENAITGEKITYKELTQYAVTLAVSLKELGVGNGYTVGIGSEKRLLLQPTALAVLFTGAAYTPYDLQDGRATLKHKLDLVRPKYFICSQLYWNKYGDILKSIGSIELFMCFEKSEDIELSLDPLMKQADVDSYEPAAVLGQTDDAVILYSSGTTGLPKGVQLTHLNCIYTLPKEFEDDSLNTVLILGDWFHGYDMLLTYKLLSLGRRVVYVDEYTPENLLKSIQRCQVEIATLVPSLVGYLSKEEAVGQYDLSSLRIVQSRSAPLRPKIIEMFKSRFPTIKDLVQVYGMTETGVLTSESIGTKGLKLGSVGMACPGVTLKVVDPETRKVLGPNQRGEICVQGPILMKGYIGLDLSAYLDEQGFFATGDLGYYDDDRYFYIVDRLKEIFVYDGDKISPSELEAILQRHPGVLEAGVIGKPAGDIGEDPTAFVVRRPGSNVSGQELVDYISIEVPPTMQLRGGVVFVPKLPRNPSGKILRRRLTEMLNDN